MSKAPPPLSIEQAHFERCLLASCAPGVSVSFSRNDHGDYHAEYVRVAWRMWQHARAYRSLVVA